MATTRTEDVRKVMNTAMEQVRTSLLAALGAGSLASQAVADAVSKARTRVSASSDAAKKNIEELPSEFEQIKDRLDPAELRKLLDDYTEAATKLYQKLVSSGEQTWEQAVEPQVKRGIEQFEEALRAAQERVDVVTTDARERVDEMVALLTRRAREAEQKVDEVATGEVSEDKPGPVKAASTRVPAKTTAERSPARGAKTGESKQAASGTATDQAAKAASARKKAMKPDTRAAKGRATTKRQSANGSKQS
ncbi:hypothetical protein [Saccharomonospora xinjiangensis]|uniref:Heparin binding hemagglutinin HbhA n=1 Tax=Saccharomonospora xinjiangensis XJ-54 TaxID=882086 RepID=I0V1M8_9PSEU|nr:hypothetical protein [Saccharomonospora xinjiangensis]EID54031.1 hypothetical protein SacxiDRAFT_1789 [Saccharomonospora xinjiangensis XJ-54]